LTFALWFCLFPFAFLLLIPPSSFIIPFVLRSSSFVLHYPLPLLSPFCPLPPSRAASQLLYMSPNVRYPRIKTCLIKTELSIISSRPHLAPMTVFSQCHCRHILISLDRLFYRTPVISDDHMYVIRLHCDGKNPLPHFPRLRQNRLSNYRLLPLAQLHHRPLHALRIASRKRDVLSSNFPVLHETFFASLQPCAVRRERHHIPDRLGHLRFPDEGSALTCLAPHTPKGVGGLPNIAVPYGDFSPQYEITTAISKLFSSLAHIFSATSHVAFV